MQVSRKLLSARTVPYIISEFDSSSSGSWPYAFNVEDSQIVSIDCSEKLACGVGDVVAGEVIARSSDQPRGRYLIQ